MTRPTTTKRPRIAPGTVWVAVLAVSFALFGAWTGMRQLEGSDDVTATGGDNTGQAAAGSAMQSDASLEYEHRRTFASYVPHVQNEPPRNDNCPNYRDVTSKLTTTVRTDTSLILDSDLHVVLTGVRPVDAPLRDKLQRPEGARAFASCFIATDTQITSFHWADGKIEADLKLQWNPITGYTNQLVRYRNEDSALVVDLCLPHPEWAAGVRSICRNEADNTVVIRVVRPIDNLISVPFPTSQVKNGDSDDSTWEFHGPMPRLTVMLDVPDFVRVTSWLTSSSGRNFTVPLTGGMLSADLYFYADTTAIFLAFIVAAILLGRNGITPRPIASRRRLLLFALAIFALGFQIQYFGNLLAPYLSNGVIVVVSWALLAMAVARRRLRPAVVILSLAALAPLCFLAIKPQDEPTTTPILTAFCIALVALVGMTGWALWRQVSTLFSLVKLDGEQSVWHDLYRRVLYCFIVAAFMYAIGFPVGEALREFIYPTAGTWEINVIASNLIWSTGLSFRYPLAWVGLLVVISFLAGHLLNTPRKVVGATAAFELALLLSLSAPWINQIAIGIGASLPVWLIQFAVLLIAFRLLISGSSRRRTAPTLNPRKSYLLTAAKATAPKESESPSGGGRRRLSLGSSERSPTRLNPTAGPRLLVLGSQNGRLSNAKAAAQLAAVVAIIPVGYLVWTTLAQLPEQLATNTGMMVVVLLAVLEFVRWVVSGFVFGYLYSKLPGRVGPVKALAFAAIWIGSCLGPLVVAHAAGRNLTHETIYRSAQFALFVIVLAVLIDLKTVKTAGGTWRDLRSVYDLASYGDVAAAIVPAALLAVTLAQQIAAGSGFDVANSLLTGITGVLKGP
jgi:hypothetical protein